MLDLTEFENIHKDKDIYILASGKSVDFIDNSFFENKIVIGINQVYKKIQCKYLVRKEYDLMKEVFELNKDSILFVSKGVCGGKGAGNLDIVRKNNFSNAVVYNHNLNNCKVPKTIPDNGLVVSWSTITTGIHLAAYMGAKNIMLVGHDCGPINGEPNFKNYHSKKTYKLAHSRGKKDYIIWLRQIEAQTIAVKNLLKKKYNCNIHSINPFVSFNLEGNIFKSN